VSESAAAVSVAADEIPEVSQPEIIFTSGVWRIPRKLSFSLCAMFRAANQITPTQSTLDAYISGLLESEIASFRLSYRDEINSRPPMRAVDPTKEIREVTE
jgi:hypothetical protein